VAGVRDIRIGAWRFSSAIAAATGVVACGGDDEADDDGAVESDGTLESTGTDDSSSDTSSDGEGSSSGADTTTSAESDESTDGADASTTGVPEDPSYPAPDGSGACPNETAPIQFPGASVCAPFCAGADAACPPAASGDAVPTCTPFADEGGSGTPCRTHDECPGEEACDPAGTCVAVAFWACRLVCDAGETCSDGMTCAAGACGYP
jgi:hypothetical protein